MLACQGSNGGHPERNEGFKASHIRCRVSALGCAGGSTTRDDAYLNGDRPPGGARGLKDLSSVLWPNERLDSSLRSE